MQSSRFSSLNRALLFFIFTLSGFSGLIYELIWTNYLKLLLGHAAYAQTLVLMIFMGGMAMGAWIASRLSVRLKKILIVYVGVEIAIGILGLAFDPLFRGFLSLSYQTVIPSMPSPYWVSMYTWGLSSLFILPQSILLGMTFPLMSNALMRDHENASGATVALLYFTNSIGAAMGVLVCGFYFIPTIGLPGAMQMAALINFFVAAVVSVCAQFSEERDATEKNNTLSKSTSDAVTASQKPFYRMLLLVAFVTGVASFMYEIAWVRLLAMVLGAATHAFEMMLSSFILGIALGGLWIQRRVDGLKKGVYFLSLTEIIKGLLALVSLVAFSESFNWMQFFMHTVARNNGGYTLFNVMSYGIAMAVMLPTTFCAGMTLPLITRLLLNKNGGEKAVGQVYAINTIGAIVGVFVAVHFIMPLLSLKAVIVIGALLDCALGFVLWRRFSAENSVSFNSVAVTAVFLFVLLGVAFQLNPYKLSSGVFRVGYIVLNKDIVFQRDGKTASVDVSQVNAPNEKQIVISTNGKPDASIGIPDASGDEITQIMAAALPVAVSPNVKNAAVIGFGSGMTAESLLQDPALQRVDTIEIEPMMVKGAKAFMPFNRDVYESPRSHIVVEDAKVFFARTHHQFDLIVSEPSNPWVSGVSSLFTTEFYAQIKQHLSRDGIFCQWVHTYEMNWPLLMSMLKALDGNFLHYRIYSVNDGDLIILASNHSPIAAPSDVIFQMPRLRGLLSRVYVKKLEDIHIRHVIDRRELHPYLKEYLFPTNSDYYPVVDFNAVKARFLEQNVNNFGSLGYYLPMDIFFKSHDHRDASQITPTPFFARSSLAISAEQFQSLFVKPKTHRAVTPEAEVILNQLNPVKTICVTDANKKNWMNALFSISPLLSQYLTPNEAKPIWDTITTKACPASMPEDAKRWLNLFEAVNDRNVGAMQRIGSRILSKDRMSIMFLPYLVGVVMISDLAEHNPKAALTVWQQYQAPIQFVFQKNEKIAEQFALSLRVLAAMAKESAIAPPT